MITFLFIAVLAVLGFLTFAGADGFIRLTHLH